ncbi:MAG: hypothetical protein R3Y35_12820 [Clostridia bacterium]
MEEFNDKREIAVAITLNEQIDPVITYDISFTKSEYDELMLKVAIYRSDLSY